MDSNVPRSLAAALAVSIAVCASACAVPLAPGYRIVKESRDVRFVSGQPAQLQVRAQYALQNTGTTDLSFVDLNFPEERAFGRTSTRVELDGRDVTPANLPPQFQDAEPDALRIPLDPPWARKQSRKLTIEYTLRSPDNSGARITIGENSFHLGTRAWYPALLPPKHVLAPYPNPPKISDYTVRVPADFLVLASGTPKGRKKEGDEIAYRFQLDAASMPTFVVAGRYSAWPAQGKSQSTVFWTTQPLKDDPGPAAQQIAAAWNALEKDFGPLGRNIAQPHIVESAELRGHLSGEEAPAAVAFPGGAIVNPAALALGTSSNQFLAIVTHALAHEWFGDAMYMSPGAALGMGEGLPEYATIVIDEARNGPDARHKRITEYLRRYDEASKDATESPLGATMIGDAVGPRRIALAKAPLFFAALEDVCGEAPMRSGLAHLLAVQRGREAGYADLRASLEQSCNRDFAPMFRLWLNGKGIPEDFRQRYQGSAVGEVAEKPLAPRQRSFPADCTIFNFPISNFCISGGTVKEIISTDKGPKAIGPYSQATKANGLIFTAGQVAFDPATSQLVEGDVARQTARVMENLKAIVEAAGSSLDRALKATVYLKDMNDFAAMNEVYARYFPANPPARSTVEAARLPRDVRVEIDLIVAV